MADNTMWYVVQTYSGYENNVLTTIQKHVDNRNLHDLIQEICIPMETVTELTDNGPKTVERKIFPGYVLIKMVMNDETWHVVRNIRGVTGFVGAGDKPTPLTPEEVTAWGVEKHETVETYHVGDVVTITDGPFRTYKGRVEEVDLEKDRISIAVFMGGREVSFDLEMDQVVLAND